MTEEITVIIATTAERQRRECLSAAIDCILTQSGVRALPLVVVNGTCFDPETNAALQQRDDIRYHYREDGNQTRAMHFGVTRVTTPFFAFLDDDDIYLPDALATRLAPLREAPDVGLSVTTGYIRTRSGESRLPFDVQNLEADPLAALLDTPWLSSCAGLYRTSQIKASVFDHDHDYMQWTYLASVLCRRTRVSFIDKPTFVYNFTENSASASPLHEVARARIMQGIADTAPTGLKDSFLRKKYAAYHAASEAYLRRRDMASAWKYHLLCLGGIHGLKYAPYTLHLLKSNARRSPFQE